MHLFRKHKLKHLRENNSNAHMKKEGVRERNASVVEIDFGPETFFFSLFHSRLSLSLLLSFSVTKLYFFFGLEGV